MCNALLPIYGFVCRELAEIDMTLSAEEMTDKVDMTHKEHVSTIYVFNIRITKPPPLAQYFYRDTYYSFLSSIFLSISWTIQGNLLAGHCSLNYHYYVQKFVFVIIVAAMKLHVGTCIPLVLIGMSYSYEIVRLDWSCDTFGRCFAGEKRVTAGRTFSRSR